MSTDSITSKKTIIILTALKLQISDSSTDMITDYTWGSCPIFFVENKKFACSYLLDGVCIHVLYC